MNVDITYSRASLKFMKKTPQAPALHDVQSILIASLKKIYHQEDVNVDVKQLRGIGKDTIVPEKATSELFFRFAKKRRLGSLYIQLTFAEMYINRFSEHLPTEPVGVLRIQILLLHPAGSHSFDFTQGTL